MSKNISNGKFGQMANFLKKLKISSRLIFIFMGIISTIWFLIRVIPKPSRATYPCMKVTAPWASAFIIYLIGVTGSVISFRKFGVYLKKSKYLIASVVLVTGLLLSFITIPATNSTAFSAIEETYLEEPNSPIGVARGIFPGRVVWVFNPDATEKNCENTYGNAYFMDENTNQDVVDQMLSNAVIALTEETTVLDAWDAIFRFYNQKRGKGDIGYEDGEIIFLKINRTSSWAGNYDGSDFSRIDNYYYALTETTPQIVQAVLNHLVNKIGIDQKNIYVGDPMKHIYKDDLEKWSTVFPNVHYLDNYSDYDGREPVVEGSSKVEYSDKQTVLSVSSDNLYTIFDEMEYMINLPSMKAHIRAGVTMFAKNHFGSHTAGSSDHLHAGLVKDNEGNIRSDYGEYRVLTDLMGHELLGGKSLIYIMDALYSSEHELYKPVRFQMTPFENDYTSSIFISQDPVAIESVGFDFLYSEFDGSNEHANYPHYGGVDDYLHQAADKSNWPEGITYDPENDGTEIGSLGVHEHWNNAIDKQYSRNLGTGEGIELIKVSNGEITSADELTANPVIEVYPNPSTEYLTINIANEYTGPLLIQILDINGKLINLVKIEKQEGELNHILNVSNIPQGSYFIKVTFGPESLISRLQIN